MLLALFFICVVNHPVHLILSNHYDSNIEHYLVKLILYNAKSTCILLKILQIPKEKILHLMNIT